jgi:signal transduction histidine kinase
LEFVAGVTHELRTPLAVIQSAGENIADGIVNSKEQYKKYGSLIRDEGKRLGKMVEQVLDFAGIQSKQHTNKFESINLKDLINDIQHKFKKVTTITTNFENKEIIIKGDKNALSAAFTNIIDNSIKYSDDEPQIIIEVDHSENDKLYSVKIKDNGHGIPENEIKQIFEPFFRGKAATDRTIPGSGLGLSLVKGIIENHGGTINVISNVDSGCEFNISLPVVTKE